MLNAREFSECIQGNTISLSGETHCANDFIDLCFVMPHFKINTLYLFDYKLTAIDITCLIAYRQFRVMQFNNCSISDDGLELLFADSRIDALEFKNCRIDDSILQQFLETTNLKRLQIDDRDLIASKRFHVVCKDSSLNVCSAHLGATSQAELALVVAENKTIKTLYLEDVIVDAAFLSMFSELMQLRRVELKQCSVDDRSLWLFKYHFPNLKSLNINGRNTLERADIKTYTRQVSDISCLFISVLKLSDFSSGLSHNGRRLTINSNLLKQIDFIDLVTYMFDKSELNELVLQDLLITPHMVVILNSLKRGSKLHLIGCSVKDRLLAELISNYPGLVHLHLSQMSVGSKSCNAIAKRQDLECFELSNMHLTLKNSSIMFTGSNIQRLIIRDSQIDADGLAFANRIQELELYRTVLDASHKIAILENAHLQSLVLHQTNIDATLLDTLLSKSSIKHIGLQGDVLDLAHAKALLKHKPLQLLDLSGSIIHGEFLKHIAKHPTLNGINFSGCPLLNQSLSLIYFLALTKVKTLNLSQTGLNDVFFAHLYQVSANRRLPHVRDLDVSGNSITNKGLRNILNLYSPYALNLSGCAIKDMVLASGCERLQHLNISHTSVGQVFLKSCPTTVKTLDIRATLVDEPALIGLISQNSEILTLDYDASRYSKKFQDLVTDRLVLNYKVNELNEVRLLFNYVFSKFKDETKSFELLKYVFDNPILKWLEQNIAKYPVSTNQLNYVYGR